MYILNNREMRYIHDIQLQQLSQETESFEPWVFTEIEFEILESQTPDCGRITIKDISFEVWDMKKAISNYEALCKADQR